jgi:RNA polymerase sigma-70 factor (ECF subfamily)
VERDELEIVEQCKKGDQDACRHLVDAYARMVGTVILRATNDPQAIEDLVQETFLRVFRALAYFDGRARLSTWIYTIGHHVAIDHLRKHGRWREESQWSGTEEAESPSIDGPVELDPEVSLAREETRRLVQHGLAQLPEKYRLPVVYAAIEGLDYSEIAEMLGIPIGTVKTLIFRGKRMLKDQLKAALKSGHKSRASDAL